MKRYLTLRPRPKSKDASHCQGAPITRNNKEKQDIKLQKKLDEWKELSKGNLTL